MIHGSRISLSFPADGLRKELSLRSAFHLYPSVLYAKCNPSSPFPLKYENSNTESFSCAVNELLKETRRNETITCLILYRKLKLKDSAFSFKPAALWRCVACDAGCQIP